LSGEVSAVVVTANTLEMTTVCVRGLLAQAAEVIVVDNGSGDGTAAAVRALDARVRVVGLPRPTGFARASNLGAAEARSEYVLFANSDVTPANGAVGRLVAELDANRDAVAAGGRLVDPGTERTQDQYRPRTFPGVISLAVQLGGLGRAWPRNPVTRRHLGLDLDDRRTVPVDQPAGACLLVRRSAFDAVGGFDEGFWFWYEDIDLALRLNRIGILLYVPSAVFEHHGGASFARWTPAQIVLSRHHGLLRYVQRHFGPLRRTSVALVLLPVLTARGLLARNDARAAYRRVRAATLDLIRSGGHGPATRRLAASLFPGADV
jgi:N-acetylglucosaminyl-diphospho-decaprenol L-rhamnosyltransferase